MSMSKGTKPRMRSWMQCEAHEFKAALNSMRDAKITLRQFSRFNQEIHCDENGTALARKYQHKKSEQYLIHVSMAQHVPQGRVNTTEGSIYAAL